MATSLTARVAELRRRARLALLVHGGARLIAIGLATVIAIALADYLLHFQHPGIRVLCTAAVCLGFGIGFYRYLLPAVRAPLTDLELARRIEDRFPHFSDRVSSAVEFIRQSEDDPHAGSAALRRAVVVQTAAELEQLDVRAVLRQGPVWRSLAVCGLVLSVGICLIATDLPAATLALLRLARPLGADAWPQKHHLAFRNPPLRMAGGESFAAEIIDTNGRLPDKVTVFFRNADDVESQELRSGKGKVIARRDTVSRSFSVRAEGGDDRSMPWQHVEVVPPPKLASLQVKLHWPQYTGWMVSLSDPNIRALRGAKVELVVKADRPLSSAEICVIGGETWPLVLSPDGRQFHLSATRDRPLTVNTSGEYWLKLVDQQGIVGGRDRRYTVTSLPDDAPTVVIDQSDGNLAATATASIPLPIVAKDDIKLREITLHYSRSDRTDVEEFHVPVWSGPSIAPPGNSASYEAAQADRRAQTFELSLAPLELQPGTELSIYASASDYLPQVGKSLVRRISIVQPQELEQRLADQAALVLAELARALKLQQEVRATVQGLQTQIAQVSELTRSDIDQAQAVSLNQRQIARTLTHKTEGVPGIIERLLMTIRINRLEVVQLERRMRAIAEEVARLDREHLGRIDHDLAAGIKNGQSSFESHTHSKSLVTMAGDAFARAGQHQDQVIASLEKLLGELSEWDSYRRFAGEIAQIEAAQREIMKQAQAHSAATLAKELKDLEPQQRADLAKLGDRQLLLARRIERLEQAMGEMSAKLKQSAADPAATLADAADYLKQSGVTPHMRDAAQGITENRIGQAGARQQQVLRGLAEVADILSGRKQHALEGLIRKLRESEKELAQLRDQQGGLQKKAAELSKEPSESAQRRDLERLMREQRELEAASARLARKVERLDARTAARRLSQATLSMKQAGDAAAQGRHETAAEQALAAERKLQDAQRALAKARRQAEELLARQEMIRLEDTLTGLHVRQKSLLAEARRLEELRSLQGRFNRPQLSSVRELARDQHQLETETGAVAGKLAEREVLKLALSGAQEYMNQAARSLESRETGSRAQAAQEAAISRLAGLLSSLAKPKPKASDAGSQSGGGSGGGGRGSETDYSLAEVKTLKLMQQEVAEKLEQLAGRARNHSNDEVSDEFAAIAREQGKLAELALKLSEPPEQTPEEDADAALDDSSAERAEPEEEDVDDTSQPN